MTKCKILYIDTLISFFNGLPNTFSKSNPKGKESVV